MSGADHPELAALQCHSAPTASTLSQVVSRSSIQAMDRVRLLGDTYADFVRRGRPLGVLKTPSSLDRAWQIGWTRITRPSTASWTEPATIATWTLARAQRRPQAGVRGPGEADRTGSVGQPGHHQRGVCGIQGPRPHRSARTHRNRNRAHNLSPRNRNERIRLRPGSHTTTTTPRRPPAGVCPQTAHKRVRGSTTVIDDQAPDLHFRW